MSKRASSSSRAEPQTPRARSDPQSIYARDVSIPRAPRWLAVGLPILVGVLAFAAFYPALSADFVNFDDGKNFENNTEFRGFSPKHLAWMFTTSHMGHYQPLTWLSAAMDHQLFGLKAQAFHRTNVILHAISSVLVYFLSIRLIALANSVPNDGKTNTALAPQSDTASCAEGITLRIAAAVAALLFAVHPLRVESVAWISERRDVLSLVFLLAAAIAFLRSVRLGQAAIASWPWYGAACGLLLLSLLSKAWGMTFFVIVTLLNMYPLRRLPWNIKAWLDRRYSPVWWQTFPFVVLGIAAALRAAAAQNAGYETMKTLDEWGVVERVVQAFYGLAFYIRKTLWPANLAVLYELPPKLSPFELKYILSALGVILAAVLLIRVRKRVPALFIAAAAYVIWVSPVLGLSQSGPQFVADRYSYVSCIGFAILAGGAFYRFGRRGQSVADTNGSMTVAVLNDSTIDNRQSTIPIVGSLAVSCLLIAVLFTATFRQARVWQNSQTLWAHAIEVGAHSALAHLNHGLTLREAGRTDEAVEHFRASLTIKPENGSAWIMLANALRARGDFIESEAAYRKAVEYMLQKHLAYNSLGEMYFEDLDRVEEAVAAYRAGIAHMEEMQKTMVTAPAPTLYLNLGVALRAKGDLAGAQTVLQTAARFKSLHTRATEELQLLGTQK